LSGARIEAGPANVQQLKKMKNKKVRQYYEKQNDRLSDWCEVDAIVNAVADDVLESFNPDPDYDGIPGLFIPLGTK
jgi:hypothetical protein